jgi:hypothetical protein
MRCRPDRHAGRRVTALALAALAGLAPLVACGDPDRPSPPTAGGIPSAAAAVGSAAPGAAPTAVPASKGPTPGSSPAAAGSCPIFPADNVWHADVSRLPVRSDSARLVASIGTSAAVHADFGSGTWEGGPIGIPITTVPAGTAGVTVRFEYADESDRGPYPIPKNAKIEGGPDADGDRHIILLDRARCRAYELFAAHPTGGGGWRAGSGAVYDLRSNALRPRGWTSADAAGLPIIAGLVRYEEVAAGRIDHAIRITAPRTRDAFVWPARHAASSDSSTALPPMGLRLRLKSDVDTSRLPKQARVVAEAMKRHGVILADNGSPWYISGAPDERWDNDALRALAGLRGSDFEAVDTASLMASQDSGKVKPTG